MKYPFSKEESMSRRQFWTLFGGKFLQLTEAPYAIHDDAWTAEILHSIMLKLFPQNVMTPDDIYMATCMAGMISYNSGGYFFKYNYASGITEEIIQALSPYIAHNAYVKMCQELGGLVSTATEEFYTSCCSAPIKPIKIHTAALYDAFTTWCDVNDRVPATNRSLFKYLREKGHTMYKGYLDGICGANYFRLPIALEEVDKIAEPKSKRTSERTEAVKKELEELGAKLFKNDSGGRDESSPEDVSKEEEAVPTVKEDTEDASVQKGDVINYGENVQEDQSVVIGDLIAEPGSIAEDSGSVIEDSFSYIESTGSIPEDIDSGDIIEDSVRTSEDNSSGDRHNSPEEDSGGVNAESGEPLGGTGDARRRVNHLPAEQREALKEMKINYMILGYIPNIDEFREESGIAVSQELYELFVEYLKG